MSEYYDNLPVFWDKIVYNWVMHYCYQGNLGRMTKSYLMPNILHENLCFLEKSLQELVNQGYFSFDGYSYHITEKGVELAEFHEFC